MIQYDITYDTILVRKQHTYDGFRTRNANPGPNLDRFHRCMQIGPTPCKSVRPICGNLQVVAYRTKDNCDTAVCTKCSHSGGTL